MIAFHSYRTVIQGTSLALSRVERFTPMPGVHNRVEQDARIARAFQPACYVKLSTTAIKQGEERTIEFGRLKGEASVNGRKNLCTVSLSSTSVYH
jgi:hypothetical protein